MENASEWPHWYHRPTVSFNGRGLLNPTSSSSTPRLGCLPRRSAGRAGTAVRAVTAAHRRRRRSFPAPLLPPSHQRFSAAKGNGAPRQGLTMRWSVARRGRHGPRCKQ
ncbi:unnamed protein product [Lampetra fluviatilis]